MATLYLTSTATSSPFPTTSRLLSETSNASEVQLGPGEFDSGIPGTTDCGQWNPNSAIADTTAAAEIDNTGASLGTTRQGFLWNPGDLTGKKLKAGSWTVQLRLRANQGTGTLGRIFMRVTVVTGSAGAYTTVANLLTTNIVGEASHSTGQNGWRAQTDARITVTSTAANFSVTVGDSGTSAEHTFASGEALLFEFGFGDADSATDRTWRLDYNTANSFVVTPAIVSAITGTSDGSSTVSGTLTGDGVLAGSAAGAATVSGASVGKGALSGSSVGASTVAGELSNAGGGAGAINGSSAGTSTAAGALTGRGGLAGSCSGVGTAVAALVADGVLAGSCSGIATATGVLRAKGQLAANAAGSSSPAATLSGDGALTGTSSGTVAASATLTADGALAGTSSGTGTGAATLRGKGQLAGSAAGSSTATGSLNQPAGAIAGSSAGGSTVLGALTAKAAANGNAGGASTVAGLIRAKGALAGLAAGVAVAAGTLTDANALPPSPGDDDVRQIIVSNLVTPSGVSSGVTRTSSGYTVTKN